MEVMFPIKFMEVVQPIPTFKCVKNGPNFWIKLITSKALGDTAVAQITAPEALEDPEEGREVVMAHLSHSCSHKGGSLITSSSQGNGEEALAEAAPAEAALNTMAVTSNEYSSKLLFN